MRSSDVFYAAAIAIMLAWLILASTVDVGRSGGAPARSSAVASAMVAEVDSDAPQPVATMTVDGRSYRIFVGGSPDVWSVAVGEDD